MSLAHVLGFILGVIVGVLINLYFKKKGSKSNG